MQYPIFFIYKIFFYFNSLRGKNMTDTASKTVFTVNSDKANFTEGFSEILTADNFREAQKLHNAICEYIAHIGNIEQNINPYNPNNKFTALLRADKEAIYKENPDFGKTPYPAMHPTARCTKHFNEPIAARKAKGVQRNAAETLLNIYNHIHAYGKQHTEKS